MKFILVFCPYDKNLVFLVWTKFYYFFHMCVQYVVVNYSCHGWPRVTTGDHRWPRVVRVTMWGLVRCNIFTPIFGVISWWLGWCTFDRVTSWWWIRSVIWLVVLSMSALVMCNLWPKLNNSQSRNQHMVWSQKVYFHFLPETNRVTVGQLSPAVYLFRY